MIYITSEYDEFRYFFPFIFLSNVPIPVTGLTTIRGLSTSGCCKSVQKWILPVHQSMFSMDPWNLSVERNHNLPPKPRTRTRTSTGNLRCLAGRWLILARRIQPAPYSLTYRWMDISDFGPGAWLSPIFVIHILVATPHSFRCPSCA